MVPFADFINHHNVDSSYELISEQADPSELSLKMKVAYFTVSKSEVDYSDMYGPSVTHTPQMNNRTLN